MPECAANCSRSSSSTASSRSKYLSPTGETTTTHTARTPRSSCSPQPNTQTNGRKTTRQDSHNTRTKKRGPVTGSRQGQTPPQHQPGGCQHQAAPRLKRSPRRCWLCPNCSTGLLQHRWPCGHNSPLQLSRPGLGARRPACTRNGNPHRLSMPTT